MTSTPLLAKEKRAISETNAEGELEDSDCETIMPSDKKARTARKLSMTASEDDE
ncbi:hypothetical protein PVAP13_6KG267000 [Panicum virgatum]|uniref:Uncharacterized protein n=2 Tax=Panicum virgatum TaxID=38727 RepID=A0A8T0RF20_PANVG|nr:hypothetical protein PVAP13_6KG267000 [Panicum virgatum]